MMDDENRWNLKPGNTPPPAEPTIVRPLPNSSTGPVEQTTIRPVPGGATPTVVRSLSGSSNQQIISGTRTTNAPQLEIGTQIDDLWTIESTISKGTGEAVIYRVVDPAGNLAALKLYHLHHETRVDVLERLQMLNHPDILPLLGAGEWGHHRYEIYAFAAGGNAADRIPFSDEQLTKSVIPQVLNGLEVLHAEGVIHRDIKPENFFYMDPHALDLVIGDFGAARYKQIDSNSSHMFASSVFGTTGYMPPEYHVGVAGPFTDYFALGMSLLRMRGTDVLKWWGSWQEWNRALVTESVNVREMVPEPLGELIDGLLVQNYQNRWGVESVRRWLAGERNIPIVRSAGAGYKPLTWRNQILRNRAEAADYLYKAEPDAWTLYSGNGLRRWVVDSNTDIEAAERLDSVNASSDHAATLREAAFALDPLRPFETPSGERLEALVRIGQKVDEDLRSFLTDATRQRQQLELFIRWRATPQDQAWFGRKLARTRNLSDRGFFARLLYLTDPTRSFLTLSGQRLPHPASATDELLAIAREVDANRSAYASNYALFREEFVALLDSRDRADELAWLEALEQRYSSDARRIVEIAHHFGSDLGVLAPSGTRLRTVQQIALDLLRDPLTWSSDAVACADLQAFAEAQGDTQPWPAARQILGSSATLPLLALRALAIELLRPTETLARVAVIGDTHRERVFADDTSPLDTADITWNLHCCFSLGEVARAHHIELQGPLSEPQAIGDFDLVVPTRPEVDLSSDLQHKLPVPTREFDGTLAQTQDTLQMQHAAELRAANKELRLRRAQRGLWTAAPILAAISLGWLPGAVLAYYTPKLGVALRSDDLPVARLLWTASLSATAYPLVLSLLRTLAAIGFRRRGVPSNYAAWTGASIVVQLLAPIWYCIIAIAMWVMNLLVGLVVGIIYVINNNKFSDGFEASGDFLIGAGVLLAFLATFVFLNHDLSPGTPGQDSASARGSVQASRRALAQSFRALRITDPVADASLGENLDERGMSAGTVLSIVLMVLMFWAGGVPGLPSRGRFTDAEPKTAAVQSEVFAVVNADSVRVRSGPSMEAKVLDGLNRGTDVIVLEVSPPWVHIRYERDGRTLEGWMHKDYLGAP